MGKASWRRPRQAAELRAKGFTVTAPYGEAKAAKAAPPDPFARPDVRLRRVPPVAPEAGALPGHVLGRGGQRGPADQPADLVREPARRAPGHRQEGRLRQVALRPGPGRLQGQPSTRTRWPTAPSPSSGTRRRSTRASGSRPRSAGACSATCSRTRPTTRPTSRRCCKNTEMWFVPVVNVDGYDWTFQNKNTRLWRKNLRDNDGDDVLTGDDGVDTNRNWAEKWRYDQEGAVGRLRRATPTAARRRSPSPRSAALDAMFAKLKPKFLLDYHSYGPLILYPEGWQVETHSTDTPATAGARGPDDDHPAIADFDPDVSGELYTTNGDVTGHVYNRYGSLAYTVELDGRQRPGRRRHRRRAELVHARRLRLPGLRGRGRRTSSSATSPFALDLARSAKNPGRPVSHLGNVAPDFVPTTFKCGYGDPQTRRGQREPRPRPGRGRTGASTAAPSSSRADDRVQGRRALRPARRLLPQAARQRSPASRRATRSRSGSRAGAKQSASFTFTAEKSTSPATCS